MTSVTGNSKAPFMRLVVYYLVLALMITLVRLNWPDVYALFSRGAAVGAALFGGPPAEATGPLTAPYPALATALMIVGTLVIMVPVAWVYMITKQREGYDRSVVQTLIVLPTAICGVVVIVQNSYALAFALAGIVAAVRFRNTLKDTKDAVYVFLAIGVGLAAGVQNVNVALIMSVLFNITILALWFTNFGNVYAGQLASADLAPSLASPSGGGTVASPEQQWPEASLGAAAGASTGKPPNAVLHVRVSDVAAARPKIEAVLAGDTKLWYLVEAQDEGEEGTLLQYLVRKKKSVLPASLVDKLEGQCAPHVIGVEYRPLAGTS